MQAIEIWLAFDTELGTGKMRITIYELYESHDGWVYKKAYRVVEMREKFWLDQS